MHNIYSKICFWHFVVLGALIADLSYLVVPNAWGSVVTLGYFLTVPGLLLLCSFKHRINNFFAIIGLALVLSLFIATFLGLTLNTLHYFGVDRPLSTRNIFTAYNISIIFLLYFCKYNSTNLSMLLARFRPPKLHMLCALLLLTLPLVAVGGTIRLNNGASGSVVMALFLLVAVLFFYLVRNKNVQHLYPLAVVSFALSILLTTSLRSWYIMGHDIQREYFVFHLVNMASFWDVQSLRSPYNACLSITILPTVLNRLAHIQDIYIFKVVFQVIFAVGLLPMYYFLKKVSNAKLALFGSFIFISFPTFLNDMPMLNRQEIGLIFFGGLMFVNALTLTRSVKTILALILIISLILSHYSSSYVALALILLAAIIWSITAKIKKDLIKSPRPVIFSARILIIGLTFTFLWNTQITNTSNGLKNTVKDTISGILDQSGVQSGDVAYSIFGSSKKDPNAILQSSTAVKDSVVYSSSPSLPLTAVGNRLNQIMNVNMFNTVFRSGAAKMLQLLLFVGAFLLCWQLIKSKKSNPYLAALTVSAILLLTLQTLLPQLSVDYGTLRFFQQLLIIISLPITLGLFGLLRFISESKRLTLVALSFAILFLHLSGFIPQMLGGYPPQLALNNAGGYYESYYITANDKYAMRWLTTEVANGQSVYMDNFAGNRFYNETPHSFKIRTILDYDGKGYVYQDTANKQTNAYQVGVQGSILRFIFTEPLGDQQNAIYSNGRDGVLK